MATKRLEMTFKNQADKNSKVSIDNPKDEITEIEIKAAMDNIVNMNVFDTANGDLVAVVSARIVSTEVQELVL